MTIDETIEAIEGYECGNDLFYFESGLSDNFYDCPFNADDLKALAAELKQLREFVGAMKWVAVNSKDDLPPDGRYLWTCNFGQKLDVRPIQLLTRADGRRCVGPATNLIVGDEVLAYMPLPEPYTEAK